MILENQVEPREAREEQQNQPEFRCLQSKKKQIIPQLLKQVHHIVLHETSNTANKHFTIHFDIRNESGTK